MKKKLLLSVLAAGLVLPSAAALANDRAAINEGPSSTALTPAMLERDYAAALTRYKAAYVRLDSVSQFLLSEQMVLNQKVSVLEDAKLARAQYERAANDAHAALATFGEVDKEKPSYKEAVALVEKTSGELLNHDLKIKAAKEEVDKQQAKVDAKMAEKVQHEKELAAALAELEAAKAKYINAGGDVSKLENPQVVKPGTVKEAGKKVLPKTSAVK